MRTADIESICRECAEARGWVPVPFAVGVWPGRCNVCGQKELLCAPRDYRRSEANPRGRTV